MAVGHPAAPAAYPEVPLDKVENETGRLMSLPYLALHREEFTWPQPVTRRRRWALTPPFHPLPRNESVAGLLSVALVVIPRAEISNLKYQSSENARMLSGSLPCGVRTFLSRKGATARRASLQGVAIITKNVEQTNQIRLSYFSNSIASPAITSTSSVCGNASA